MEMDSTFNSLPVFKCIRQNVFGHKKKGKKNVLSVEGDDRFVCVNSTTIIPGSSSIFIIKTRKQHAMKM